MTNDRHGSNAMRRAHAMLIALALAAGACAPAAVDWDALTAAADARTPGAARHDNENLARLLSRPLTAESAARVAVLNNRGVRAAVEELGVAEARLSRARRLPNPTVEGAMRFEGDGRPELEVGAMIDLTDLLLLASRSGAAGAEVEAAKLGAVGSLLDLSFDTRRAFYEYQAAAELLELRRTVLSAFDASADLAQRLRDAGNITELELAHQRSLFEEARIGVRDAEVELAACRERLNVLMGLWGRGTGWRAEPRLPEIAARELALETLERTAVDRSLELAMAKQRFSAADRRASLARAQGLLPELKAGVSAERSDAWSVGPAVEIELPLFYQGQGEVGVANAEMRKEKERFADIAVQLRASARSAASRLIAKREAARRYESVLLPLKAKLVEQTQLEYNGMLVGLFQLLQVKRDQVEADAAYVELRRDYWIARTNVEQLLAGRRYPEQALVSHDLGGNTPSGVAEQH